MRWHHWTARLSEVPTSGMPKRGYHHGNLREALIKGCLSLIEKRGPTGFTLSEAAREAGVTPAAVYRHFDGREDMIAAAALKGYELFGEQMQAAYGNGQPSALAAFEATGRAYLAFARQYPGYYIAMFESGISINRSSELHAVATRAMGVLEKAAEELSQHIPAEKRPPPQMFSAHIWAMSHGVVELFARSNPGTQSPFPPEDLLESGIGIYLRGLGLIAPDK
jgi:AcrR family transcriptional regulator